MLSRPASPSALHALPPSQGQGLAAVRHFDPAYVGLGQNPKSTVFGLMSASTGCGHDAKSGFVSTVQKSGCEQVQLKAALFDHFVGSHLDD